MIISYVPVDKGSWSTRLTSIPDHSELWLVQMRMRKRYLLIIRVEYKSNSLDNRLSEMICHQGERVTILITSLLILLPPLQYVVETQYLSVYVHPVICFI